MPRGHASRGRLWTPEEDVRGRAMLAADPKSAPAVAAALGRSVASIYNRNRRVWRVPVSQRRNWVNAALFDSWSPAMAYALGAIASDGNLWKGDWRISISQSHDYGREWLEGLRELMGGRIDGPFKDDSYHLVLQHKGLWHRLVALGVPPAKSRTLEMPAVPAELLDHFVRGVFDGDGSVCDNNPGGTPQPQADAVAGVASVAFATHLREAVRAASGLEGRLAVTRRTRGDYYTVRFAGRDAFRFLLWLYERADGVPFLRRKREFFREMFSAWKAAALSRPERFRSWGGFPDDLVVRGA